MRSVYFDTSVFLAILNGEDEGASIRALVRELKKGKGAHLYFDPDRARGISPIISVRPVF